MNARQQYAINLRRITAVELLAAQRFALDQYEKMKAEGHCACEAVCYFDLKQVESEMERRNLDLMAVAYDGKVVPL